MSQSDRAIYEMLLHLNSATFSLYNYIAPGCNIVQFLNFSIEFFIKKFPNVNLNEVCISIHSVISLFLYEMGRNSKIQKKFLIKIFKVSDPLLCWKVRICFSCNILPLPHFWQGKHKGRRKEMADWRMLENNMLSCTVNTINIKYLLPCRSCFVQADHQEIYGGPKESPICDWGSYWGLTQFQMRKFK